MNGAKPSLQGSRNNGSFSSAGKVWTINVRAAIGHNGEDPRQRRGSQLIFSNFCMCCESLFQRERRSATIFSTPGAGFTKPP